MAKRQRQGANMEKLKEFADSQKKGEFYNFEQGETLVYIHPPCREDDDHEPTNGMNFIPVGVHYGIGKAKIVISLDPVDNTIIEHPFIKDALKKRRKKIKLTGKCPVKAQLEGDDWTDEEVDAAKLQMKFFWGITPVGFRKSRKKSFVDLDDGPCVCMTNATINSGFMDAMLEYDDVSNPDEAVLVRVKRTGTGMNSKYEVTIDPETAHTPKAFSAKEKKRLYAAMENQCDLFSVVANMIRSPAEVQSLIDGVSSDDDDDDDDDDRPARGKRSKKKASKKKAPPPDEDDDDEDDDDDDEDEDDAPPPKKSKSKSKKKSKPVEDDDEDDDEEEDDPPPKKSKKKKTSKKSKAPPPEDDDEDEEDDDDDDDDEDDPPKKTSKSSKKKTPPKKSKSKSKSDDDDDDDDDDEDDDVDVGDLNAELNEIDDEDDDDDDDDDDDEDEPPKKTSKKTSKSKSKSKRSKK